LQLLFVEVFISYSQFVGEFKSSSKADLSYDIQTKTNKLTLDFERIEKQQNQWHQ